VLFGDLNINSAFELLRHRKTSYRIILNRRSSAFDQSRKYRASHQVCFAGQTEFCREFIGTAVLFLPFFVFILKIIQMGMKADTEAAINA